MPTLEDLTRPFALLSLLLTIGVLLFILQLVLLLSPRLNRGFPMARKAMRWIAYAWLATMFLLTGLIVAGYR